MRTKPAELTAEEQARYDEQLEGFKSSRGESSLTDTIAEVISATVNHAVIDTLSPPKTSTSSKFRSIYAQSHREFTQQRKEALAFIESQSLEDYLKIIKMLGRSGANAKVIRKLVRKYIEEGKFLYISQSAANVMTADEWAIFQADNTRKWLKTYRKDSEPQESNHAETQEIPLSCDKLAA